MAKPTLKTIAVGVSLALSAAALIAIPAQATAPTNCFADVTWTSPAGTERPEQDDNGVCQISDEKELLWLSLATNEAHASFDVVRVGAFKLTEDVDLDGITFTPIAGGELGFKGTFDGGGKKISNLNIVNTSDTPPRLTFGLFGEVAPTGIIKNLELTGVDINTLGQGVGGLAGISRGQIENVSVSGSVVGYANVGGLVGENFGKIEGSSSGATVSAIPVVDGGQVSGGSRVGGLVGYFRPAPPQLDGPWQGLSSEQVPPQLIENSFATGNVSGRDSVGGLVGLADAGGKVTRSYATGSVTATSSQSGGLIGSNSVRVEYSFSSGNVVGAVNRAGGLIGRNEGSGSVSDSFALGSVTVADNTSRVGGFVGQNQGTVTRSYSVGKISINVGSTAEIGGFAGANSGTITNSYWDTDASNQTASAGGAGVVGKTTQQMKTITTFANWPMVTGGAEFDPDGPPVRIWGICATANDGYPFLLWAVSVGSCGSGEVSAPAPFAGPLITSPARQAAAGSNVTFGGSRLGLVTAAFIDGKAVEILSKGDSALTLQIPADLAPGRYDLVLESSMGRVTIQAAIRISGLASSESRGVWTRASLNPDGSVSTVRFYAKDPIGIGKLQFKVNGREIAWIRAIDETDPKLRARANGLPYLVRTITLAPGKNALEIFVDGTRVWRAAYTGR